MKYLLFQRDGFLKKFPLDKQQMTIGRGSRNDLVVADETFSRHHVTIQVLKDGIEVRDMDSTNGTFVADKRIERTVLHVGESFSIGGCEFILRTGNRDEFRGVKLVEPWLKNATADAGDSQTGETRYIQDIYRETLKYLLQSGLRCRTYDDFFSEVSRTLSPLGHLQGLMIIARRDQDISVLVSVQNTPDQVALLEKTVRRNSMVFRKAQQFSRTSDPGTLISSIPVPAGDKPGAIVYFCDADVSEHDKKVVEFVGHLASQIEFLCKLIGESEQQTLQKDGMVSAPGTPSSDDDIVVGDDRMKNLVLQARKIAGSEIFILIQGESGTGKELFARLIHRHSRRKDQSFVALNCAAIPENLLESELFGYEKGAFTGAYAKKQGKLQSASGGTLVLDEIGDMSLNLQAKLLRALQEHEFYPLGSQTPVSVNLRIISLTNHDIQSLIREKRMREDLYYRLAHHVIVIPPLRDRRKDIPVLIDHFIRTYSRRIDKAIGGVSVPAYRILQEYSWPGNVRQLENEINRLVNLVDPGQLINHDLLSIHIRENDFPGSRVENSETGSRGGEDETGEILHLLEENGWNKSKTARDLGMTYMGLHKKMKRLGIDRPAKGR